jgi:hypothetical protein
MNIENKDKLNSTPEWERKNKDDSFQSLLKSLGIAILVALIVILYALSSGFRWVNPAGVEEMMSSIKDLLFEGHQLYNTIEIKGSEFLSSIENTWITFTASF